MEYNMNELAKLAFATHYHYLLKAQNFHWNVTGPDFLEYHELFEDIYTEVYDNLDKFAEHLRALGIFVPASFSEMLAISAIKDPLDYKTKDEMVECLYRDNGTLVRNLLDLYKSTEINEEYGFSSFIAERLAEHRKHGWQLYSSLTI